MKLAGVLFLFVFTFAIVQAQDVLFHIDNNEVTVADFMYHYQKQKTAKGEKKKGVEEFLQLYIKYKLKLHDAYVNNMDKTQVFLDEYFDYKKQLERPYLKDTVLEKHFIKEAYERMQVEVDVSHILLKLPNYPTPEDTLEVYNRMLDIKKQIDWGESFEQVAVKYSEDPSVVQNKGKLAYFTAFQMLYPFETASYITPIGDVSDPFRSEYGYHLVKVYDRQPSRGEVEVAHIMLKGTDRHTKVLIDNIKMQLDSGASFETLARNYSQDESSKSLGGLLPTFGVGQMLKPIEDVAYSLQEDCEISKPFQTKMGWHILKLIKKHGVKSFEESKDYIIENIMSGERGRQLEVAKIKNLMDSYTYAINWNLLNKFNDPSWQKSKTLQTSDYILIINNVKEASVLEFYNFYKNMPQIGVNKAFEMFKEQLTAEYYKETLIQQHPEIAVTLQNYEEGLLIYNQMQQNVWQVAKQDSLGLQDFYNKNKKKYNKPETVKLYTVTFKGDETKVLEQLKKAAQTDDVSELLNNFQVLNIKDRRDVVGHNDLPKNLQLKKDHYTLVQNAHIKEFYYVQEHFNASGSSYQNIKMQVQKDYEDYIEDLWIKELKEKYKVSVNKKVLRKLKRF